MLRPTILLVLLLAIMLGVTGCNTIQGIGRDITWVGEKTEEALQ